MHDWIGIFQKLMRARLLLPCGQEERVMQLEYIKTEKKKSVQITIRMPVTLKEQLHTEANEKGISFNAYVLLLIEKVHRYQ